MGSEPVRLSGSDRYFTDLAIYNHAGIEAVPQSVRDAVEAAIGMG